MKITLDMDLTLMIMIGQWNKKMLISMNNIMMLKKVYVLCGERLVKDHS